jgi:CDP-diacylglycerol pyrophosphatase
MAHSDTDTTGPAPLDGAPGFTPPSDCGDKHDRGPRDHLWVDAEKTPDPLRNGYVIFDGGVMGFSKKFNGLLVPKIRITGIECSKVVGQGAQNYWVSAWKKEHFTKLPGNYKFLGVNSFDGRTQDQLHIHMTALQRQARTQLDNLDTKSLSLSKWNSNIFTLTAQQETYVYRIAHVDNLDTNPFDLLDKYVATQKDSAGKPYNDRFAQSLAVTEGPNGAGFFLIATQGKPSQPGQPPHAPDLAIYDPQAKKNHYGTSTVEPLMDRNWK